MDCIDLFKRAAVALQTDPRYLALDQARKANDNDENLQNLIGEFNLARMDLNNEIGKSERDDARITELNEKVNNLYGQIMGDEGMTAYNEANGSLTVDLNGTAYTFGKKDVALCRLRVEF